MKPTLRMAAAQPTDAKSELQKRVRDLVLPQLNAFLRIEWGSKVHLTYGDPIWADCDAFVQLLLGNVGGQSYYTTEKLDALLEKTRKYIESVKASLLRDGFPRDPVTFILAYILMWLAFFVEDRVLGAYPATRTATLEALSRSFSTLSTLLKSLPEKPGMDMYFLKHMGVWEGLNDALTETLRILRDWTADGTFGGNLVYWASKAAKALQRFTEKMLEKYRGMMGVGPMVGSEDRHAWMGTVKRGVQRLAALRVSEGLGVREGRAAKRRTTEGGGGSAGPGGSRGGRSRSRGRLLHGSRSRSRLLTLTRGGRGVRAGQCASNRSRSRRQRRKQRRFAHL